VGDLRAPFLLLAHHRSGSNLLNDLLQAHPCIECLNEPFSMHTPFFREHDLQLIFLWREPRAIVSSVLRRGRQPGRVVSGRAPAGPACERIAKGGAWSKGASLLHIGASRSNWARLGTTTIGLRPVWDDQ